MKNQAIKLLLCRMHELSCWYRTNFRNHSQLDGYRSEYDLHQAYLEEIGCSCVRREKIIVREFLQNPDKQTLESLGLPEGRFVALAHPWEATTIILIPEDLAMKAVVLGEFPAMDAFGQPRSHQLA
jgi:hypothetical protein